MKAQITVALPGREPRGGVLTTEHAASRFGLPVVVCDWTVYGSADVLWIDGSAVLGVWGMGSVAWSHRLLGTPSCPGDRCLDASNLFFT